MRRAESLGTTVVTEIATRRTYLAGRNNGQAAASSLSLLKHHDSITWPEYRSGLLYAHMRLTLWGRATAKVAALFRIIADNVDASMRISDDLSEDERQDRLQEMRRMYAEGDNRLRAIPYSMRVREMVRRVCIDDMLPDPGKPVQLMRLRRGLNILAGVWGMDK
jgi:hypothetical protein